MRSKCAALGSTQAEEVNSVRHSECRSAAAVSGDVTDASFVSSTPSTDSPGASNESGTWLLLASNAVR